MHLTPYNAVTYNQVVNLHTDLVPVPQCQIPLLSHPSILYLHEQITRTHMHIWRPLSQS